MKFATKLAILFSGIYVLSGLIITIYLYTSNASVLEDQISERLEDLAVHTMDKIDRMLFEKYADIKLMATDPIVRSENSTPEQVAERIRTFNNTYGTYITVTLINTAGAVIADTSGIDIDNRELFDKAWKSFLDGKEFVMDISKPESIGRALFNFSAIVKGEGGAPVGVLITRAPLDEELYEITSQVIGLHHDGEDELEAELVDKNGRILYSSYRPVDIMKPITSDLTYVNKFIFVTSGTAGGRYSDPGAGNEIHVFAREKGYRDFRGNNWTLLLRFPKDLAFAPAIHLRNQVITMFVSVGALTLLCLFVVVHNITKPIVKLSHASIAISQGNLDVEVEKGSNDELGHLAESFKRMVSRLKEYEAEVAERTSRMIHTNERLSEEIEERKRIEDSLQRHAERLKILHQIDRAMRDLRPSEEIAREAIQHLKRIVPYRWASVALMDDRSRELVLTAVSAEGEAGHEFGSRTVSDSTEHGLDQAIENEMKACNDMETLFQRLPTVQPLEDEGIRSLISVPLSIGGSLIGTLNLCGDVPNAFTKEDIEIVREAADFLAVSVENARLFRSVDEKREQLRSLTSRLVEAEETERRQLALALHDGIGQNLSALNLNLNLVAGMLPTETTKARVRLEDSQVLLEEVVQCVRNIMWDLRPPGLDENGLADALRWYVEEFSERTSIPVAVKIDDLTPRLPASTEIAVFRMAQEALTNIARHSRATQASLALEPLKAGIRMTVEDNGIGFNPETRSQPGKSSSGLGLIGMRERAENLGGCVRLRSSHGKGTSLIVEV